MCGSGVLHKLAAMESDGLTRMAGGREHRLERLIDTGRTLVSELDLEAVLQRVLDAARELTERALCGARSARRAGAALERFLTVGIDEETHRSIGDLPRDAASSVSSSASLARCAFPTSASMRGRMDSRSATRR